MESNEKLEQLSQAVISGKHFEAESLTKELLALGLAPGKILDEALMKGMGVVGQRFRDQLMFVPQVLVAARAMKFSMKILEPHIVKDGSAGKGRIMIGTVKSDVHDIGKNLVAIMLQGSGYEVIDIGTGCTAEKYFEEFQKSRPDVIGMSALLTTTMVYMKTVIDFFREKQADVPLIIGGAPINQKFADEIGAAGYARSAYEAVMLVDKIIGGAKS